MCIYIYITIKAMFLVDNNSMVGSHLAVHKLDFPVSNFLDIWLAMEILSIEWADSQAQLLRIVLKNIQPTCVDNYS